MRIPHRSSSLVAALLLGACGGSTGEGDLMTEGSYLSADERQALFDLERADRLLGLALRDFNDGIRLQDQELLRSTLAEGFRCVVPVLPAGVGDVPGGETYGYTILAETQELDTEGFLRWTSDFAERFDLIETVALGRYQNSKEIIEGPEAVAESAGAFRIAGWRNETGLMELAGLFRLRHDGFARFDGTAEEAENEEPPDSPKNWIHGLTLEQVSLVSSDDPLFVEVTESCGIDHESLHDNWRDREETGTLPFTGGGFLGDVSADGHLDLLVTEIRDTRLYLGRGDGTFEDSGWRPPQIVMKGKEGVRKFPEPYSAIFDATGDGRIEVMYGGVLFRWNEGERRMDQLPTVKGSRLPNADMSLCDFDGDGLTDVYTLNSGRKARGADSKAWFDDDRVTGTANQLWRNKGGGVFENVTQAAKASGGYGRTFAATWFYANDDDWPDLFGANEFGRNVFLVNEGDGTFREADDVDDVFGGFSMGVTSGDLDGDGKVDLYVSNMYSKAGQRVYHHLDLSIYPESAQKMFMASVTGNRVYRSRGDLSFDNLTTYAGANAVGWGWSGALLDADLDGWLDAYAPCGYNSVDASKPDG